MSFFDPVLSGRISVMLVAVLAACGSAAPAQGDRALTQSDRTLTQGDRALIIAIGDYRTDPRIPPLRGPAEDAKLMQGLAVGRLGYKPESVKLLLDADATRVGILKSIDEWLVKGTRPGDRVLLHYSGHGAQIPDENGDEADGLDEVLVSYDARIDLDTRRIDGLVIDDEIEGLLAKLKDRQVTVIVDACHSGTVTRAALGMLEDAPARTPLALAAYIDMPTRSLGVIQAHREEPTLLSGGTGLTLWTAVSAFQEALDDVEMTPRSGHFTNRFVKGLTSSIADSNGDGQIAHAELLAWLRGESKAYCDRNKSICRFGLLPTLEIDPTLLTQPVDVTLLNRPPQVQTAGAAADIALASTPSIGSTSLRVSAEVLSNERVCHAPGCELVLDSVVQFRVESSFDGYLTLLNIDPAGRLIQIFPNSLSVARNREGRIRANQPLTVPEDFYGFEFKVNAPLGDGRLIALVTEDAVDLRDIVDATRSLVPIAAGQPTTDHLARIAERLRKPWTGGEFNREARWAVGEAPYRSR